MKKEILNFFQLGISNKKQYFSISSNAEQNYFNQISVFFDISFDFERTTNLFPIVLFNLMA